MIQGKKALPTEFALYLYPRANHLAKQAKEFEQVALSAQDMKITEFKICYDVQISMAFLTELDATIAETYPSLLVHWLHRNRHDALAFLEKDEAQVALMPTLSDLLPSERVGVMNIGASKLGIYAHPASPLARLVFFPLIFH
ncbi:MULTISPECIES: hypothetical protein [unclassified Endozoicomonas]|uniref:hypothetical protein n=1 Tax=unclassified Endozoicomonas TaxID=2644528 RepID=UPI002147A856|nr:MULTISPECIES: hypothetical protein [unclassified Endozoicomonas]